MTTLADLRDVLPGDTSTAWAVVAPVLPYGAYLAGGTAIAVHLRHRVSRDLDFFLTEPFDPEHLAATLDGIGRFAPTLVAEGTLNGVLDSTKVQFLDASSQRVLAPTTEIAGVPVAALPDLLATTLKVIGDRGELRDYFDVMQIEELSDLSADEGFGLYVLRYDPRPPEPSVLHILGALGYLDDVADDPYLAGIAERHVVERYWQRRQPEIARSITQFGMPRTAAGPQVRRDAERRDSPLSQAGTREMATAAPWPRRGSRATGAGPAGR
ncbi:nucleotidyl transferase AbiEii/AbiGii toxin family protein [Cellulomonas hominis]